MFNGRPLTPEHLETITLEIATDYYQRNVATKKEEFDLELEISVVKEEKINTAFYLRKKMTISISNNDIFAEYFQVIDLDNSNNIWRLLSMIPNNRQIRREILQMPELMNIEKYTDLTKPKKVLYYMNVLNKILTQKKELEFVDNFVKSGQAEELARIVSRVEAQNLKNFNIVTQIIQGIFPVLDHLIQIQ